MTTTEIARELNKNGWYQKKDKSEIIPYQIHGRTKNYPELFDREGSMVSLKRYSNMEFKTNVWAEHDSKIAQDYDY